MKSYTLLFSYLILSLTLLSPSRAATVSGLYETEVPVYGTDSQARSDAMSRAFIDVLVRVSGNRDVSLAPGIPEVLKKPERFAQQFRYQKPSTDFMNTLATRPTKMLWVSFDTNAVNKILQSSGLPIWGQSRPSLMVWLIVEQSGERRLVDAQYTGPGRGILEYAGVRRGVPMILPLMDTKDQVLVKVQDVWAGFLDELLDASKRYNTEAVLIGRVSAQPTGGWQGRWTIVNGDQPPTGWQNAAEQFNDVILSGVDGGSDILARRYAQFVDETSEDVVLLKVSDLKSLGDYAKVKKYLTSLAPVSELLPTQVVNDYIVFRVRFKGSQEGLTRAIKLGNVLFPLDSLPGSIIAAQSGADKGATDQSTALLVYRLMP